MDMCWNSSVNDIGDDVKIIKCFLIPSVLLHQSPYSHLHNPLSFPLQSSSAYFELFVRSLKYQYVQISLIQ